MKFSNKEEKILQVIKKKIMKPEYEGIFVDLLAFTGLKPLDLCDHILKARTRVRNEFNLVNPKGAIEHELFYRCCREYLFLNALRPVWDTMIEHFEGKKEQAVLDFAGGMGNDSAWLSRQDYFVIYHEIGIIQREFMQFRRKRNNLNLKVTQPHECFNQFDQIAEYLAAFEMTLDCIVLRDVLEHIPNYEVFLKKLSALLKSGGHILEQTPWNRYEKEKNRELYSPLHQKEGKKLTLIFEELGFTNESKGVWKKHA